MADPVTDPNILAQLNASPNSGKEVIDADVLRQLNGGSPTWGDTALDTAKSFGSKFINAATGFVPGMVQGGQTLENIFRQRMGIPEKDVTQFPNVQKVQQATAYEPKTGLGGAAGRAGEFMGDPASYLGPESIPLKAAIAGLSGVGSYGGQQVGQQLAGPNGGSIGSLVGALAGGMTPTAAAKAITPMATTAAHARDVAVLEREGIPLTAGDRTGNKTLRAAESELSPESNQAQRDAFQQAAFNRIREPINGRPITGAGGALDTARQRIGQQFDNLQARNSAVLDNRVQPEMLAIQQRYTGTPGLYGADVENAVNGALGDVSRLYGQGNGVISGTEYQLLRSRLNEAAMGAEGQRARALHEIVDALDNNMERSIQANNPADAGAFRQARNDWRNYLVLQRWGRSGNLTPAALDQAGANIYGEAATVTGRTPFAQLSEAAKRSISEYQTSETARRGFIGEHGTKAIAALGGYLGGMHYGNPEIGVAAGLTMEQVGQLAARPVMRAGIMSTPVQNYLGNQLLTRAQQEALSAPMSARLARALLQTQAP